GATMSDPGTSPGAPVPTAYTFFGQFVDHDITLEQVSDTVRNLSVPDLTPIPFDGIEKQIVNFRSPNLDLDSVYSPMSPRDKDKMLLGEVSYPRSLPNGIKDAHNDLPRRQSSDPRTNGRALIGDPRNDENVIVSQLHVAFLRAHNALVDMGFNFDEARKLLI